MDLSVLCTIPFCTVMDSRASLCWHKNGLAHTDSVTLRPACLPTASVARPEGEPMLARHWTDTRTDNVKTYALAAVRIGCSEGIQVL